MTGGIPVAPQAVIVRGTLAMLLLAALARAERHRRPRRPGRR
ncbi:hypothetical protein WJ438_00910 [Streptomyces sp. GD-15H]